MDLVDDGHHLGGREGLQLKITGVDVVALEDIGENYDGEILIFKAILVDLGIVDHLKLQQ